MTLDECSLRGFSDGVHFFRTEAGPQHCFNVAKRLRETGIIRRVVKLFRTAVEIDELRQISDVVVLLVAAFPDHKTACRRGEGVKLVQQDAVVAGRIFELAVLHLADRFDRPPGTA